VPSATSFSRLRSAVSAYWRFVAVVLMSRCVPLAKSRRYHVRPFLRTLPSPFARFVRRPFLFLWESAGSLSIAQGRSFASAGCPATLTRAGKSSVRFSTHEVDIPMRSATSGTVSSRSPSSPRVSAVGFGVVLGVVATCTAVSAVKHLQASVCSVSSGRSRARAGSAANSSRVGTATGAPARLCTRAMLTAPNPLATAADRTTRAPPARRSTRMGTAPGLPGRPVPVDGAASGAPGRRPLCAPRPRPRPPDGGPHA